ncbi:MAG: DUF3857 and transglutaminase domain-containing protein [candidate division Zixibacteria bacterium]|nr:DUF3857 and transglutaminase domain-containing protein [candidate division Zixibacteria bacterium]
MIFRVLTNLLFSLLIITFLSPKIYAAPLWLENAAKTPITITPHKDASILVIYKTTETEVLPNGSYVTKIKEALKVLIGGKAESVGCSESISNLKRVKNLKGWRIKTNGKEEKLSKDNVVEIGLQTGGYYHDSKTLVATFPEVETGDIIGYEYTIKHKKSMEGYFHRFLIQRSAPTLSATFSISLPEGWEIQSVVKNLENVTYPVSESNTHSWHVGFSPFYPDEPHSPPNQWMNSIIYVNCFEPLNEQSKSIKTWQEASSWAWNLHKEQAAPDESISALARKITAGKSSWDEKLLALASYVRDEVRYVAVELGIGRFQPYPASITCDNKFGDCKDKTTLLRALFEVVGISSEAVLVNASHPIDTTLTSPFVFDHVIIAIKCDESSAYQASPAHQNNAWVYFDPTNQSTDLGYLPRVLYGCKALHLSDTAAQLITLPELSPEKYIRRYFVDATLHEDFSMSAHVRIVDYLGRAAYTANYFKNHTVSERIDNLLKTFAPSVSNLIIENYSSSSSKDSTWAEFDIKGDNYLKQTGDYYLFKSDFCHKDMKSALKKKRTRKLPIFYGTPAVVETTINWTLPELWTISDGLDSISAECSIASVFSSTTEIEGKTVFYSHRTFKGGTVSPEGYKEMCSYDRKKCKVKSTKLFISKP